MFLLIISRWVSPDHGVWTDTPIFWAASEIEQVIQSPLTIQYGKTCKQIAPHLNRKERASTDRVISEFNRVNDMLLHRVERAEYDKKKSPIDLTREEYYAWLDKAVCARDSYLAGKLPEEEAIQIIHMPTIQELRAIDTPNCTQAGSGA